jgi:hypothetical protein
MQYLTLIYFYGYTIYYITNILNTISTEKYRSFKELYTCGKIYVKNFELHMKKISQFLI